MLVGVFGVLWCFGRWDQRSRWAAYWVGFGAVTLPSLFQEDWQLKSLLVVLAFIPAVVLMLWQRLRTRPSEAAPTTGVSSAHTQTFTGTTE